MCVYLTLHLRNGKFIQYIAFRSFCENRPKYIAFRFSSLSGLRKYIPAKIIPLGHPPILSGLRKVRSSLWLFHSCDA
ncbi:hypothetical protein RCL_jg29300.t1 [Rhizophagus clarus]|uniref:Uncharacterized protein n=1 Tax=Rhizophagus clarus TaxID=94130 RepID=A0A8H3QEG4_9GLOM|nr:hypothetical protein RCL_jg29300.t1 [Rhizophagus clarus]